MSAVASELVQRPAAGGRRAGGLRHSAVVRAGTMLVGLVVILAVAGPALAPMDPFRASGAPLQPPGAGHWMGTDDLGRDILSGVLHGTRVSLLVGVVTALIAAAVGVCVGATAGFYGGLADDALMRFTELVQTVPRFFLAVLVAALFGPSLVFLVVLLGLTFWPGTARLLRAQVLSLREREYILAARALGLRERRIVVRHIVPNIVGIVVVSAALQVGTAILVEASLSFLGLGDRSVVSWGYMLNNAQPFLRLAWWMSLFPGLALVLAVLGANLLADGAYAAWDPRARR
ncbi:ABC transporter permease [soil metagenome]